MTTKLIKIDPKDIVPSQKNIFFGLGLIRNDFSDLVYLQRLHFQERKKIGLNNTVSAENGRGTGRDIYIFRMVLSHFYAALEFLRKNQNKIATDKELLDTVGGLSLNEKGFWELIIELSTYENIEDINNSTKITKKMKSILILSHRTRHDLTYHYYAAPLHLSNGYKIAFNKRDAENTKYACATELSNIDLDRSYYTDLSIQKYLESQIGLSDNLIPEMEGPFIEIIASFNKVISKLLKQYHEKVEVKT